HDAAQQQAEWGQQLQNLQRQLATEREARLQEQKHADEKLALLAENKTQLLQEFENLSQKIFEHKQKQFGEQSQKGLESLLNPFKEQLEGLRKKVDDVYVRSEEHTSELQSRENLVCRL